MLAAWRAAGARGRAENAAWRERVAALPREPSGPSFERRLAGRLPDDWRDAAEALPAPSSRETRPTVATRKACEAALEVLTEAVPELLGGSADLTHSNNTVTKQHAAGARRGTSRGATCTTACASTRWPPSMNGIALHGGFVPYGGTFLVFADYCRPRDPPLGADGPARRSTC